MAMTENATYTNNETQNAETENTEKQQAQNLNNTGDDMKVDANQDEVTEGTPSTAVAETVTGLHEECDRLRAERDGLMDRLARLQAEFDNARKREQRERADYRSFAIGDAVEQFLPVLDNFKLALNSKGSAEQLRTGVELIAKQMDEVLRSLNVTPVETVGHPFDPRFHEALESVERPDVPDHQVIEETRRGYRIKDRLLRPALVKIAVNPNVSEA
ncbi:MAG TPA: nucleotide exchange factor GrpE [Acidobacteriaceae bacterium]|nr:nucleotide exchange factor GrpE [Acidobacteriaceae bacterium]